MWRMLKYFISSVLLLLSFACHAQMDDDDSTAKVVISDSLRQLRFNFDLSKPAVNFFQNDRSEYNLSVDYYYKKEIYLVAEGGFGNAKVNYDDLKYNSNNTFFKIGVDKSLFARNSNHDWDMAFIGARYGIGLIHRGAASYTVVDSFWGNTYETKEAKDVTAHWFEVTGGVRLEVVKSLFVGWNIRGKFRLNQGAFKELPPSYIAGYGKGDKNAVFDFNFYVGYALRWQKLRRSLLKK